MAHERSDGHVEPLGSGAHAQSDGRARSEARALELGLALLVGFMACEVAVAVLSSSIALLADAAHMLTDAAALAMALVAARLARRPARGALTFGLGRAEILSAQANGMTLLVLALVVIYGAVRHLVTPPDVAGGPVLAVALVGIAVNLVATRALGAAGAGSQARSLNVEGSYQHLLTDLLGFIATAVAAIVILASGLDRADAIASLIIAAIMLRAAYGLLKASLRVMMEAAPSELDPAVIGRRLAAQAGVVEIHDLHIWEVTSGFSAISAHIVVQAGHDCHEVRVVLARLLAREFGLEHSTLQAEHAPVRQPPLQIETSAGRER